MAIDSADLLAIQNAITMGFNNVIASMSSGGTVPPPAAPPSSPSPAASSSPSSSTTLPPPPSESVSVIGADTTIFNDIVKGGEKAKELINMAIDELAYQQEQFAIQEFRNLYKNFGGELKNITSREFFEEDFSKIQNKAARTAAQSLRDLSEYAVDLSKYEGLELEKTFQMRVDFLQSFGDTSSNLFNKTSKEMLKNGMIFANAMDLEASEVANLISTTFSETGEATDKILHEITNQATSIGKAVGIPMKTLSKGIVQVKTDMNTFTDMTVESAARMVASLSQVGLSIPKFGQVLNQFRDFDSAASKLGDLSATFGIQMDAMEMMYLSNEDPEEFLHRIREQFEAQGVEIESMSKTKQRALASQMGLEVDEMKRFLNYENEFADIESLRAESAEASSKTQVDAMKELTLAMTEVIKTQQQLNATKQASTSMFSAADNSKALENIAASQNVVLKAQTDLKGLSGELINIQVKTSEMFLEGSGKILSAFQKNVPLIEQKISDVIDTVKRKGEDIKDFLPELKNISESFTDFSNIDLTDVGGSLEKGFEGAKTKIDEIFADPIQVEVDAAVSAKVEQNNEEIKLILRETSIRAAEAIENSRSDVKIDESSIDKLTSTLASIFKDAEKETISIDLKLDGKSLVAGIESSSNGRIVFRKS